MTGYLRVQLSEAYANTGRILLGGVLGNRKTNERHITGTKKTNRLINSAERFTEMCLKEGSSKALLQIVAE